MIQKIKAKAIEHLRRQLGFPIPSLALERLKKAGFSPKLLFDVGASHGIFVEEAWKEWPRLETYAFEPEPEFVAVLREKEKRFPSLHVCSSLVGATSKTEQPYYHYLGASTVLMENVDRPDQKTIAGGPVRSSRMIRLDQFCEEQKCIPDFLKIDVQGYELEVLKGAEGILSSVEVVYTEVNHLEIYAGVPLASELIGWLAQRGFALHDICEFYRRPLDQALWQSDMIFVQHRSPLRQFKRYAR